MDRECMSKINSYCQKNKYKLDYVDVERRGPSHDPEFTVMVRIDGQEYGAGTGKSKKEAKAAAAAKTWDMIEQKQAGPLNVHSPDPVPPAPAAEVLPQFDYVSLLNKYQQSALQLVEYRNINRTGDAHAPVFFCSCTISGHVYGNGSGNTLAAAKQAAAKQAYELLREQESLRVFLCSLNHYQADRPQKPIALVLHFMTLVIPVESRVSLSHEKQFTINFIFISVKEYWQLDLIMQETMSQKNRWQVFAEIRVRQMPMSTLWMKEWLRFCREYKNIEPIGKGGFGNVFKATSKIDEKTYAVKRVELSNRNVIREVKGLAQLEHENIVRYYCSWEGTDHMTYPDSSKNSGITVPCLFIQMELCEQGPLEKWIDNNREGQNYHQMALDKFLQILKGVEYIHSKQLIHRDLKPQNIFLSCEGKIKIGDFGLVTSVTYDTLTKNRGTQSYMAPEQFGNRYGKEVDIYALGLIWFEILSALVSRHEKNMVWPDIRDGKLPPDFSKQFKIEVPIIKKMLSKDPSKRCSVSQILDILKSVDKDNSHKAYSH
ncbi:UNVERIFIED_CONTAM: hypothetical protein H355_013678 [Colinus virginianus]|nr:hypothetical protein H355_013678 [Colinus virginianus]